jgi:predicted PurR-regulated permease PerM
VLDAVGNRAPLASALTILTLLVLVLVPLGVLIALVTAEAIRITTIVGPELQRIVTTPGVLNDLIERIPGHSAIEPYRDEILARATTAVGAVGRFLVLSLSTTTLGTVSLVFQTFVLLYTMFFLLMDGPAMLQGAMNYLPMRHDERSEVLDRFVSVTRATLRGTVVIGIIQGTLSGIAFWIAGINGAIFWGAIMIGLSIIPAVGGALVWVPACIYLAITGEWVRALLLAAFCSLVVGSIDNVLRPRLVGRDTKLHDLMILFSTLGGIIMFGAVGFIIGPILAALFVTVWEIFGRAYRDQLPDASPIVRE